MYEDIVICLVCRKTYKAWVNHNMPYSERVCPDCVRERDETERERRSKAWEAHKISMAKMSIGKRLERIERICFDMSMIGKGEE